MATTPALDEFETRITSIVQGAIDERFGPIIERLPLLLTQSQPSQQPSGGESPPPPTSLPVRCPVPRPAGGRRDPRFCLHTPPGVGVLSHDRWGAVAAQQHQAQGTGTRQHPARGHPGLDGGVPTAGDLNGISTFDPNEGTQPRGSGATPSTPTILLPGTSQGPPPTAPGTHIGEGLPPVPAKLVARILRHEFVEISGPPTNGPRHPHR